MGSDGLQHVYRKCAAGTDRPLFIPTDTNSYPPPPSFVTQSLFCSYTLAQFWRIRQEFYILLCYAECSTSYD